MATRLISKEGKFFTDIVQLYDPDAENDYVYKCVQTKKKYDSEAKAIQGGRAYLRRCRKKYKKQIEKGKVEVVRRRKYDVCPDVKRRRTKPLPGRSILTLAELIKNKMNDV